MEMVINVGAIAILSFGIWLLYTISGAAAPSNDEQMPKDGD